ncbi:MFS transporter [Nocardioides sp. TRM66260-LWL]|uniref:MFS transporter n=1 Tax=Nocardioides sp. TRM66260-LWL TaxID=2874478 RepID=UPI001CC6FBFE|nr:MFS transporter [Nocardioides sp. TRM66260-LWL]MBZ5735734.1 MFS transporter [Nocardioides sp. TRM66260-LWL]
MGTGGTEVRARATPPVEASAARRWSILAASTLAQAAAAITIHGPAFLIPTLHDRLGLSLAQAGAVAAAPTVGVMLALVAWGALADRAGERLVLLAGLGATAVAGGLALLAADGSPVLLGAALAVAGAAAASTSSASGRVVVGWFPPHRRGLAMGIRQMAQPVGVGVAAVSIAATAQDAGLRAALLIPAVAAAAATVLVAATVLDPPRTPGAHAEGVNPYRADGFLARVHGVSVLLVVPQFLVWTFALVWLVQERDWSPGAAGALVGAAQVAGALGRIAAGQLSDVVASRLRPLRWVSIAAALTMALLGLAAGLDAAVAVPLVVVATVVTVADNGLAFTAVAERAGAGWSGRALGVQNTAQFLAASCVPPLAGLAVEGVGYAATFAVAALFPLVAVPLVPVREERTLS